MLCQESSGVGDLGQVGIGILPGRYEFLIRGGGGVGIAGPFTAEGERVEGKAGAGPLKQCALQRGLCVDPVFHAH